MGALKSLCFFVGWDLIFIRNCLKTGLDKTREYSPGKLAGIINLMNYSAGIFLGFLEA